MVKLPPGDATRVELEEGRCWERLMAYTGGGKAEIRESPGEVICSLFSTLSHIPEFRFLFLFFFHEQ